MKIGNRNLEQWYWVLSRKENYIALISFFKIYKNPFAHIFNEFFNINNYPKKIILRGGISPTFLVNNSEDMATIHAVFCREDYKINNKENIILDIGSNRGFTIGYFLSRNINNFVYGFEPDRENFKILKKNISQFNCRYEIEESAVSDEAGILKFYSEKTGKYGSLDFFPTDSENISSYDVKVHCINDILEKVLSVHERINYIKLDTEGHERKIIKSINPEYWKKIDCIYSENTNCSDVIPQEFKRTWRYDIEKIDLI
jgi:FkbM family methyltransferase